MDPTSDRVAITDLVARYGHAVNDGDLDAWVATWTPDGHFEGSLGEARGHDDLRAFLARMKASVAGTTRDYTSNTVLDLDGDTATETSYVHTVDTSARADAATPIVVATAVYHGRLVRTAGGWRFQHRRLDVDPNYAAPDA